MKKTLTLLALLAFVPVVHADEQNLANKVSKMLEAGQSVTSIYETLKNDYSPLELLGELALSAPAQEQATVINIAKQTNDALVPILNQLKSYDAEPIRLEKPSHDELALNDHVDPSTRNDHFDPNNLPATAAGNEDTVSP